MTFLLDTNVVSETVKRRPDEHVLAWLGTQSPKDLFLPSMAIGELIRGARRLNEPERRRRYETWIENDLVTQFEGRILPFDHNAARIWGEMMGDGDRAGRPRPAADVHIAAIASLHRLIVVTRNTRDFTSLNVPLFDPWTYDSESSDG
jgi:predicted nucleic acid-binding protein